MRFLAKVFVAATTAVLFTTTTLPARDLTDEQVENLVRRSYQYVAMYNVNNKFAIKQGGWNTVDPDRAADFMARARKARGE